MKGAMDDLSAWTIATRFTATEISFLAVGQTPGSRVFAGTGVQAIRREIHFSLDEAYQMAVRVCSGFRTSDDVPPGIDESTLWSQPKAPAQYLPSMQLQNNVAAVVRNPARFRLMTEEHVWDEPFFERGAVESWFAAKGFESKFSFASPDATKLILGSAVQGASKWPWGEYETKLLKDLAAAAEKWWVRYDPSDPTTAPTSAVVTEWLVDVGVSSRVAEVMAQILRADGLPTGPRTEKKAP